MKMTPAMEAYTRQVAAEIGRDPAELIAEGEQHMDAGYHSAAAAHAADTAAMSRISGTGLSTYGGGPLAASELEAEPG